LVTASADSTARLWDMTLNVPKSYAELLPNAGEVQSVALTPDSQTAVVGTSDGTVRWYDTNNGRPRDEGRVLNVNAPALSMAFPPKGWQLLLGLGDHRLLLAAMTKMGPRVVQKLADTTSVKAVAVVPFRRSIFTGNQGGLVRVWDWGQDIQERPLGKGHSGI